MDQCVVGTPGISAEDRAHFAKAQPTARAWFDPRNHEQVWGQSLGYAGTTNLVSLPGAYYISPMFRQEKALIRGHDDEVFLRDNLCTHRQAPLLKHQTGVSEEHAVHGSITKCPIHRWAFNEKGDVIGTPKGFHDCTIVGLKREPVTLWRGFVFTNPRVDQILENFGHSGTFDSEHLNMDRFADLVEVREYETSYNPLIFDLNYPDCYHVAPFHPDTFGEVADVSTLQWEFGDGYSVQVVGGLAKDLIPEREEKRGEMSWASLTKKMHAALPGCENNPFALWIQVYPGLMLELYFGHLLAVSYLVPISPTECVNVVEYYLSKEAYEKLGDGLMGEFILAYRTSADEDDDLCKEIQAGWKILAERDGRPQGSFHNPLEDGMVHYLQWLGGIGFNFDV